jgi:hypothetical protein
MPFNVATIADLPRRANAIARRRLLDGLASHVIEYPLDYVRRCA